MQDDREWQVAVTSRFEYCERCHNHLPTTGHHVIPRRYKKTRNDTRNGIALCVNCHAFAHKNPKLFTVFVDIYLVNRGDFASLEDVWEWRRIAKLTS